MAWIRMAPIVHSPWTSQDRRPWTHQPDGHSYWVDVQPSSESLAIQATGTAEPKLVIPAESSEARSQRTVIRLRDYQIEAIDAVESSWKSDKKSPLVVLPTGCHRAGQGILMFDGSIKKVEDVEQGDLLMGPDSKPRTVLALCRGEGPMATVRPVKGREWTVNDEHVLSICFDERPDDLIDLTVIDFEGRSDEYRSAARIFRAGIVQERVSFTTERTGTVEPYFGFVLDGDHRYLLDDFTVTHNSGKTILAAETIHRFCTANPMSSALFVAHRKELLEQTRGKIVAVSDKVSVGVVQAKTNQLGRKATVASIQTIGHSSGARLADLMQHGPIGLVIVDEAHHAISGSMYDRVIRRLQEVNPGLVIMGITATPGRADGTGLDTMFDSIAYERDIFWMIDNGWLVPPTGVQVPINIDLDQVATRDGDYVESQLAKVMDQEPVRQAIVRAWMQHGQDRKMLVFCVNVAHAQSLAQDFCDAGYAAGCVWGAMPDAEREKTLNDFRLGKLKLLCNVGVLTEGYDDPSCEGILFARPTQSQGLYLQVVGRALRLYPGKTEALIIDCVGNSERHSPVQLATLAGLSAPGTPAELEEEEEEEGNSPEDEEELVVNDADSGSGRIIDFQARARRRTQKYAWRESSAGWQLSVPGLGYFLVGWMDATKTKSSVFFYDQRPTRKSDHPIRLTTRALDFDLAYGMVESEMDRLVYAMTSRRGSSPLGGGESATPSDSEGPVEGEWIQKIRDNGQQELPTVQEHMVRSDAAWRSKPPTERQIEQFRRAKGKKAKLPSTAGEMSDALSAVFTERDLKKREPATAGQLRYLHVLGAPTHNGITKGEAARLIAQYGGSR